VSVSPSSNMIPCGLCFAYVSYHLVMPVFHSGIVSTFSTARRNAAWTSLLEHYAPTATPRIVFRESPYDCLLYGAHGPVTIHNALRRV
jgi:hypothetical protein